ncbi:MAG: hypothetical protein Q4C67_04420, partial [Deinococcus sp.]|nr:hypothetical protein [Deinococcus sp.]
VPVTRWWQYQAERFPLLRHALLVTLTTACVLAFVSGARGAAPEWHWLLPATFVNLLAFFQLRVLDEFKDAETDARYRPERPVPRGLVRLSELRTLGLLAAALQLALVLALRPGLLPLLLLCWGFMALMTAEFFIPRWLKARPAAYLLSHQPIVPLLQLLASGWVWAAPGRDVPVTALVGLALVSFGVGLTLEIGRKIYAPQQEREGVETYTAAWGIPGALLAWLAGSGLACLSAAAFSQGFWRGLPLLAWGLAGWAAWTFRQERTPRAAARIEAVSAAVVLVSYLALALGRAT